jgi:hypothetical protein
MISLQFRAYTLLILISCHNIAIILCSSRGFRKSFPTTIRTTAIDSIAILLYIIRHFYILYDIMLGILSYRVIIIFCILGLNARNSIHTKLPIFFRYGTVCSLRVGVYRKTYNNNNINNILLL